MAVTPRQKANDARRAREYRRRQAQRRKAEKEEEEYMLREEYKINQASLEANEELCKSIYNLEDEDNAEE